MSKSKVFLEPNEKLGFSKVESPTSEKYVEVRKKGMTVLREKNKSYGLAYYQSADCYLK